MNVPQACSIAVASMVGGAGLFVSDTFWTTTGPAHFTTQAEAIIGRPLTPLSVAGVARRTTRRAVAAGAIGYGAYAVGRYGYPYNYGYTNYSSSYPTATTALATPIITDTPTTALTTPTVIMDTPTTVLTTPTIMATAAQSQPRDPGTATAGPATTMPLVIMDIIRGIPPATAQPMAPPPAERSSHRIGFCRR